MPKVVSSRLAWSFTRQTSQVQETAGQELLEIVPQSPAWFAWLEGGRMRAPAAISWAIDDALKTLGVWVKTLPAPPTGPGLDRGGKGRAELIEG
jgi:hypothetical protein